MPSKRQRVLLIEDDPATVRMLEKIFEPTEFTLQVIRSARDAAGIASDPDLEVVLLDKNLPDGDGMEILHTLRVEQPESQVMLMTAFPSMDTCIEAMRLGAYDYLLKPFDDLRMVVEKTRKASERTAAERDRLRLRKQVMRDNSNISHAMAQLGARAEATVITLVQALERREPTRRGHAERVGRTSEKVGHALGLGPEEMDLVATAARMADVGFVVLPDRIVLKPGPLTETEREQVRSHVAAGAEAISTLPRGSVLAPLVRHHHERFDGSGYPDGLKGKEIPVGARIIAGADTFDALVSPRPYHENFTQSEALEMLKTLSGKQLDPEVVGAMVETPDLPMPERF